MDLNCSYCNKECKNKNSKVQHEIRCKLNPDKLIIISNFIKYNKAIKNGEIEKQFSNQFIKAEKLNLSKPKVSNETKEKISLKAKNQIWDKERKEKHSLTMIETAKNNPDSYSANNVCGRTKLINVKDSFGNETKVNGGWEKIVVDYLNENKINWTNKITEIIEYEWENKIRRYYPDIYLPDFNFYIEVKGYERDRDIKKWEIIKHKLIIIKKNEINLIKKNLYNIQNIIGISSNGKDAKLIPS